MVSGTGPDEDLDWRTDAACAGMDSGIFFAEQGQSIDEARWICSRCPVAGPCLTAALNRRERFGVWAGTTPKDRSLLLRLRSGEPHVDVDVDVDITDQAKEAG